MEVGAGAMGDKSEIAGEGVAMQGKRRGGVSAVTRAIDEQLTEMMLATSTSLEFVPPSSLEGNPCPSPNSWLHNFGICVTGNPASRAPAAHSRLQVSSNHLRNISGLAFWYL